MTAADSQTIPTDDPAWLTECRRRETLRSMGMTPLVSRYDPPGAAPAARVLVRGPAKPSDTAAVGQNAGVLTRPETAQSARASVQVDAPTPGDSSPIEGAGRSVAERAAGVEFSLLIAITGRWLWVEYLEEGLLRREQLQLVQGMGRALEQNPEAIRHQQFDWPMASHPQLPKDIASARQAVAAQLQRRVVDNDISGRVILGEETRPYLGDQDGPNTLLIPSTLAMLRDPGLKSEAWKRLKPHAPGR